VGASLAQGITDLLGIRDVGNRRLAAGLVLLAGGSLGSSIGFWLGEPIRSSLMRRRTDQVGGDNWAGALFSGLAMLSVVWFLGLTFARGPNEDLSRLIQRSTILHAVDRLAPRPPGFRLGVERVLAGVPFPATFAGLEPALPAPLPPPASVDTPGVKAAANATVKIEGRGCNGIVTGSGYPVAPHYIVTSAHVVAGTTNTQVMLYGRERSPAKVVLFDPGRDLAVLYTPQLTLDALVTADPQRGTQAAVIGYPGGGPEDTQPAVVSGTLTAQGRDIYDQSLVERQIVVVVGSVRPGNSGGPIVDLKGHVLGLIFAASSSSPDQAYALSNTEVTTDARQAMGRTSGIDTRQFACAV
jgi:S1-C subfamily serine protease